MAADDRQVDDLGRAFVRELDAFDDALGYTEQEWDEIPIFCRLSMSAPY